MAPTLRALVWDVDGTLAETEHDGHRVAFNQAFAEHGLGWHWDAPLYRRLLAITGGKERLAHWWRLHDPLTAALPDTPARILQLHARKTAIYVDLVAQGRVALRPGVARLLQAAHDEGLVLAIATTTSPDNVTALLAATLGDSSPAWFACIGAGDVVPAKKPAPDIYRWVLQRLHLAPGEALALEDSAPGAAAAVAAGLATVVTRSRYTRDDALPHSPLLRADLPGLDSVTLAQLRAWHTG
jgi:beta-phosphoglucomutase-like phosphatase (HAD superfamily)